MGQAFPPITNSPGEPDILPPLFQGEMQSSPKPSRILPPFIHKPTEPKAGPVLSGFIKKIRVVGTTVFTPGELKEISSPYENRELSTEDLEDLRRAFTLLYVNNGFVTSGAIIPDQSVSEGTLVIEIIEGKLSTINVDGTRWFHPYYFESRLAKSGNEPLNLRDIRDRMHLLLQDSRIARLSVELQPGLSSGSSVLNVKVEETNPFRAWFVFNNFQSPTIGAETGQIKIEQNNMFGIGDTLLFSLSKSDGITLIANSQYSIPITVWDTLLSFRFRRNEFKVVEDQFKSLNIEINSDIYGISLQQPIFRNPRKEIYIEITAEHLRNTNTLMGQQFSFIPGAGIEGKTKISALRFSQVWKKRSHTFAMSLSSRFSFGLDLLGATLKSSSADGQFFSWLGDFQGVRKLESLGINLIGRMNLQLSNDRLLPLEQYSMGGRFTVRGYRENTLVRDNAFLFTIETRIPILSFWKDSAIVELAPFIDVGRSWFAKRNTSSPQTLTSIGTGLRYSISGLPFTFLRQFYANIYWGQQLNHVANPNQNLQDHGIHFEIGLELL